jgi:tetratricopeptide (TPR) repeat protein
LLIKRMMLSVDPEEIKKVGNDQYKKGNFAEALSLYDRAIQLSPGQASYHSNRAAALTGLGRLAEAVQECEKAIKLDSSSVRAHQRLATLCLRLGRLEGAKKHLQIAAQQHIDMGDMQRVVEKVEKHLQNCYNARSAANWSAVVREMDAAIVAGADSAPQLFALKAEAFLKLHKYEEADILLTTAHKIESGLSKSTSIQADIRTLLVQAQVDMTLGRFEGAVTAAEKAVYFDPQNAEASHTLKRARAVAAARTTGNDLYKAGRVQEASVAYSEGLQYDPTNAILLCNRAACRSKLGHYEKAVEDCNAALDAQPYYTKALLRRAHSYSKMERWDQSLKDYEALRKEMPANRDVERALFEVQAAIKKLRGSATELKKQFGFEVDVCSNDQLREAISNHGIAVVQFNTRWSEGCRQMASVVEQLYKLNPTVNFFKVDIEANPYLAKAENVDSVPTFKIYKNGFKVMELPNPTPQGLENALSHLRKY